MTDTDLEPEDDLIFTLRIRCENQVFRDAPATRELARLLHSVAERLVDSDDYAKGLIYEVNGGEVGEYLLDRVEDHGVTVDTYLGAADDHVVVQIDTTFEPTERGMRVNVNDHLAWRTR